MEKIPTNVIQILVRFLDYDNFNLILLNRILNKRIMYNYSFLRKWVKRKFDHNNCKKLLDMNKSEYTRIPLLISCSQLNHKYYFYMVNEYDSENIRQFIQKHRMTFETIFNNNKEKALKYEGKDVAETWDIDHLENISSRLLYKHKDLVEQYIKLGYGTVMYELCTYNFIDLIECGNFVVEGFGYHKYILHLTRYMYKNDEITNKLYVYFKLHNRDYNDDRISCEILVFNRGFISHGIDELESLYIIDRNENNRLSGYFNKLTIPPEDNKYII